MSQTPAAVLSEDGAYRYFLSRKISSTGQPVAFIGLNPSTADAITDDPTIRRCVGFARCWGASELWMVNLFAFRSTDPSALRFADDPIGPENDGWIDRAVAGAGLVIAAWGNQGDLFDRAFQVAGRFPGKFKVLGANQSGMPKHPLYVRKDVLPQAMPHLHRPR